LIVSKEWSDEKREGRNSRKYKMRRNEKKKQEDLARRKRRKRLGEFARVYPCATHLFILKIDRLRLFVTCSQVRNPVGSAGDYVGHNMSDSFNCSRFQFPFTASEILIYSKRKEFCNLYDTPNIQNFIKRLPEVFRHILYSDFLLDANQRECFTLLRY